MRDCTDGSRTHLYNCQGIHRIQTGDLHKNCELVEGTASSASQAGR